MLVSDLIFIWVNYLSLSNQLDASMREQAAQQYSAYQLAYEMESDNMVKMATLVATDPEIQRLFLKGKRAVLAEGGGKGGAEAARYRAQLMAHVEATWSRLRDDYGLRQIHFHIGPGSLSFLRAHRPNKFGDRMDGLRHIIVDTNRDGKPRSGFEIGRIYSGLRGVMPIFAPDAEGDKELQIGVAEVGASFDHLFSVIDRRLHGGIAAILKRKVYQGKMWKDEIENTFSTVINRCQCAVDSSSRDEIGDILLSQDGVLPRFDGAPFLLSFTRLNGRHLALTHIPLRDYLAEKRGDGSYVGRILMWRDVTAEREIFAESVRNILVAGLLGYLFIEILLFWVIRFTGLRLQRTIDEQTGELRALTRRAEESSRIKSSFLANMSHEIRTPMNAVIGMTKLALDSGPNPKQKNYLDKIAIAANSLLRIINDILDISKIEANRLELENTDFSLSTVLDNIANVIAVTADEKGVQLEFVTAPGMLDCLKGDPLRLEQVLLNLASNAVKFTERGTVTLSVKPAARMGGKIVLHFSVCDTGIGIPREQRERLFEPFEQMDSSTNRSFGGTGLGLAISKRLVELMGGEIRLESAPGEGSCFHFEILFEPGETCVTDREQLDDSACKERLRGLRVLLVEDNPLNRELAMDLLTRIGVEVVTAANGEEALQILRKEGVDGVLMDLHMPHMDGFTAAREIRKQVRFENLPIVAVSASVTDGARSKVAEAGMNDYIGKPFLPHQLYCTLARCIAPPAMDVSTGRVPNHDMAGLNAAAEGDPFAGLTSIDSSGALLRMEGDTALYRTMLELFHRHQHDFATRFAAIMESGDLQTGILLAHTLKGNAATIGALALQQAAQELELRCADSAPVAEIESALVGAIDELAPVIAELEPFLSLPRDDGPA